MRKFHVKFLREFEVEIQAESTAVAEQMAQRLTGQFPPETCKLLSIIAEDAPKAEAPKPPNKPWGRPNGGGSPGTPTIRVPELIDQIAEAA